ncbi:MAG: DAK2 domain-containing protein, partial [Dehalococcoidia bacterium]
NGDVTIAAVLRAAVAAGQQAVARTPDLLPVLREAGVVDAGGQGLCLMLEGAMAYLTGEDMPLLELTVAPPVERGWVAEKAHLQETGDLRYGYCTEFIVHSPGATAAAIRERLSAMGDSIVVAGDSGLVRVHLHTDDPQGALAYGRCLGDVAQVKVDNIQDQTTNFFIRQQQRSQQLSGTISIVAVAAGDGLVDVFCSLGATVVVRGGQTMNPSVQEIVAAIEACPTESVIVLPNNKNIILTAQQAASLTTKAVCVVHTTTIPQGVAALLACNPNADAEANRCAMEEAKGSVQTVEVTRAVRSTTVEGVAVRQGQSIALADGRLLLTAESPAAAATAAVAKVAADGSLITIYHGRDVPPQGAGALADELRRSFPQHQVEMVYGGQPHYDYIISVE